MSGGRSLIGASLAMLGALGLALGCGALRAGEPEGDGWTTGVDLSSELYADRCATCHGATIDGSALGPSLRLTHGATAESDSELARRIAEGSPAKGMPAFGETLDAAQIRSLVILIRELRAEPTGPNGMGTGPRPDLPTGVIASEQHAFRVEPVVDGLDWPYAIAPLPDGRILVSEKARGVRVIARDGSDGGLVAGTPKAYDDGFLRGEQYTGLGWMLDLELDPQFAQNGWVYLSYGDRCEGCNEASRAAGEPVSMIAVVRGRLGAEPGGGVAWVDEQSVYRDDLRFYQAGLQGAAELGAGARIALDRRGNLFLTLGVMGMGEHIQDLAWPVGKLHRVRVDGSIPADNPFVGRDDARPSIWSLGHRTPQGLAYDAARDALWETEHGPRGGDELNRIEPGHNYGWPIATLGMDYDGRPIDPATFGVPAGFDPGALSDPSAHWTPSVGISAIAVYDGDAFPEWKGDLLVATLKANRLERLDLDEAGRIVGKETLVSDVSRVRDVAVDAQGAVLLLLEHHAGSRIVRLAPAGEDVAGR